ncbi:ABC transporter permease [Cohnella rhizosphaerae]|uniref:ABC transporter permease subunit n=1 Tax=Cohnella rhizosphaerae TaxID=1457232 RepID=A0A9X4KTG8_9BACL|nr:ABC transporter permease subunit [Cohnella rhizosphaerae]MDG0809941.1 ABC transporter permease subunit [Cohnella rhizosphaerae]
MRALRKHKYVYFMMLPVMVYFIVFYYVPMAGLALAFKDYTLKYGLIGNLFETPFVGFKHFEAFFSSVAFKQVLTNTILLSLYGIIFSFPAPIILALLLNELRVKWFKNTVQSITYMPHFISLVVISGIIIDLTSLNGLINTIIGALGGQKITFLLEPAYFRTIFVASEVWQQVGWSSIIYLAAIAGIDSDMYEAAVMDGAGRWRKIVSITLPSLLPTIMVLLILRIGQMLNIGVEKIILLYQPMTYETADVISSYVFRQGILNLQISYTTAVGLFNSVINFALLVCANRLSKKMTQNSLW